MLHPPHVPRAPEGPQAGTPAEVAPQRAVVVVTGLSGAGKSSVLHALEDLGYETVDNPPLRLIDNLLPGPDGRPIAVGVDARRAEFSAEALLAALARLRAEPGVTLRLVFCQADDEMLQRRYTETRRRHPLAPEGRVADGIRRERDLLAPLLEAADLVLDTTDLALPRLRARIAAEFSAAPAGGLAVSVVSFSFRNGLPREADMVFDVRFLANPHYVADLKPKTGLDPAVAAYVEQDPDLPAIYARMTDLLASLLPRFVQEGKKYLTLAVGCTGGRHRSVHVAEKLARWLRGEGWRVDVSHRELDREGSRSAVASAPAGQPSSETGGV